MGYMIDEVKMGQDFLLAFRFSSIIIPPVASYHRHYIMLATDSVATCYTKVRFQSHESSVACMVQFTATAEAGNLLSDEVGLQEE